MRHVKETELQESGSESDDNIPVASLIKYKTATSLTIEQMQDLKEGPRGEKAVGMTVAKLFDGVDSEAKLIVSDRSDKDFIIKLLTLMGMRKTCLRRLS